MQYFELPKILHNTNNKNMEYITQNYYNKKHHYLELQEVAV